MTKQASEAKRTTGAKATADRLFFLEASGGRVLKA